MKPHAIRPLAGLLLTATLLGSGCAGSYTPIRPDRLATYTSTPGPLQFGYQYDALHLRGGNTKYTKRELKQGYRVVAVQLKNDTPADINFSRDVVLYHGDRQIIPVPGATAGNDLKQGVLIYLLYALLNLRFTTTTVSSYGPVTTSSTIIPIGIPIAAGNMIGAGAANKNLRRELEQYDLTNRVIHPGETVYGLLCLREATVAALRLELRGTTPAHGAPAPLPSKN